MKEQKLYRVSVYGTFCKDILVYGEDEEDAIDYVQDICDNTNLIKFSHGELVDLCAEDAIDLEDEGCDHDCDNCPAGACVPDFEGSIMPNKKPTGNTGTGAPLLHVPTQDLRKNTPSQPARANENGPSFERFVEIMSKLVDLFTATCEDFDELRDTVYTLLDEYSQQSMTD